MLKTPTKRLFLRMTSGGELQSLYIGDAWSPQSTFSCYFGARIPLCYRLLIEVSQQDEEHREEPEERKNARAGKKIIGSLFFLFMDLECFSNTQIGPVHKGYNESNTYLYHLK